MQTIPATEAKNRFGGVLKTVSQTGEPVIVQRDGKPVAVILGVPEYEELKGKSLNPSKKEIIDAAFGMWKDRDDIDDDWLDNSRKLWRNRFEEDDV